MKFFELIFLSLISFSLANKIIELNGKDYDNIITKFNQTDNVVIFFWDPISVFCQKVMTDFLKTGELITKKSENILFYTLNIEKNHYLAEINKIRNIPTIKLYRKNQETIEINYYSFIELSNFIMREFHFHIMEINSLEELNMFKTDFENIGIYYGLKEDNEFKILKEYLELHENVLISFGVINDNKIIETLKLYKNFKFVIMRNNENEFTYLNKFNNINDLKDFCSIESFPLINKFDNRLSEDFFKNNYGLLILFIDEKENYKNNDLENICRENRVKIRCALGYSNDEYSRYLMERIDINEKELPQFRIIKGNNEFNLSKYKPDNKLTGYKDLDNFVKLFLEGKLQKYYKSEIKTKQEKGSLMKLIRDNFNSIVYNYNKDVLVLFYTSFCDLCIKSENLLKATANRLREAKNLVIYKIDISLNDLDDIKIINFPTILLFPSNNNKEPIYFTEDLNLKSLFAFLKYNMKSDFSKTSLAKEIKINNNYHEDL